MGYLIGQLLAPLAFAALFGGGLAGWSWHCIRNRDRIATRRAEREKLFSELVSLSAKPVVLPEGEGNGARAPDSDPILVGRRELELWRTRAEVAQSRVVEVEQERARLLAENDQRLQRINELEIDLAARRAAHDGDRIGVAGVDLEAALQQAAGEAGELRSRNQLLDARIGELDSEVFRLAARAAELERENAALQRQLSEAGADDVQRRTLGWRARYLSQRVAFLESRTSQGADHELASQLEAARAQQAAAEQAAQDRIGALEAAMASQLAEAQSAHAVQLSETEALHQIHIEDMRQAIEAERARAEQLAAELAAAAERPAVRADEAESLHNDWRARYLAARVRFLEQRISATPTVETKSLPLLDAATAEDGEEADRRRWRLRYLDARAVHLSSQLAVAREREAAAAAEIAQRDQKLGAFQSAFQTETGQRDALRARITQLEAALAAGQAQLQAQAARAANLESELQRLRQETSGRDVDRAALEGELAQARAEAALQTRRVADLEAARAGLLNRNAEIEADRHEQSRRVAELEAERVELRQRHASSEQERTMLAQRLADLDVGRAAETRRISELENERNGLQQRFAALENDRVARLARITQLEGQLQLANQRVVMSEAAAQRVTALEADLERARRRVIALEAEIAELKQSRAADDGETGRLRWRTRYLDSRVSFLEESLAQARLRRDPAPPSAPARADAFRPIEPATGRPAGLPAARSGVRDDLRMITGINPRIESTLNAVGVFHFDQIAAWTPGNVEWIERYLRFQGRVMRERWIEQAQALARGEETEGKRRYLEGEQV